VDALPRPLQGDILHLLATRCAWTDDDRTVDIRVIASTTRNPEAEVASGRFGEDLFFRLNVVAIAIPPLRERREDLVALTDHLLTRLGARYGRHMIRIAPELRCVLGAYDWPGNTRELANVLESALVLSQGSTITTGHLPDRLLRRTRTGDAPAPVGTVPLRELERRHIEHVIAESRTLEETAARLGINATTLWRRRKRYGIAPTPAPGSPDETSDPDRDDSRKPS
jgi:NtrC-family two-component system response regulator AlgB